MIVRVLFIKIVKILDQFKSAHAIDTKLRTLDDAMNGADVFLGLSAKDVVSKEMVKSMAIDPIIFACANPDPEIKPELIKEVRSDAIIATGRSDYPNQVNNLIGFPYIFRGALDVRAKEINEEMKVAAANAIAFLLEKMFLMRWYQHMVVIDQDTEKIILYLQPLIRD